MDILCESSLLRRVRQLIYHPPPRTVRLDEMTRLDYNAIKVFLTDTYQDDFLTLFAEFQTRFVLYREFVETIVYLILQEANGAANIQGNQAWLLVVRALLEHIRQLEPSCHVIHSVVHDFVVCPVPSGAQPNPASGNGSAT